MSDERSTIDSEEPAKEDKIKNQPEECRNVVRKATIHREFFRWIRCDWKKHSQTDSMV